MLPRLLVAALAALAPVLGAAPARAAGTTLVLDGCGTVLRTAPRTYEASCTQSGITLVRLEVRHWGAPVARGRGLALTSVAGPGTDRQAFTLPATVRFHGRRPCGTRAYYSAVALTYRIPDGTPLGAAGIRRERLRLDAPPGC